MYAIQRPASLWNFDAEALSDCRAVYFRVNPETSVRVHTKVRWKQMTQEKWLRIYNLIGQSL